MNGLDVKSKKVMTSCNKHQRSSPEKWLDQYGDYLYNYAIKKLQNTAHAEDVVQETLLSALVAKQKSSHYLGKASEKTWLTGILNHKIIDFIRKQIKETTIDDIVALSDANLENEIDNLFDARGKWINPLQTWGNPEQLMNDSQFLTTLNHCLSKLNPIMSQIFTLKEITGQTSSEICKELDITATNYNVILYRARMRLRQCIDNRWHK